MVDSDVSQIASDDQLRRYLQTFGRRKGWIVVGFVICLVAGVAYGQFATPKYSSSATVLIPQSAAEGPVAANSGQAPAAANLQRTLSDQQAFAEGDAVRQAASKILGHKAKISVSSSPTSDVLTFTATVSSASSSAAVANAYAEGYIRVWRNTQVSQYSDQVSGLETSIAQLQAKLASSAASSTEVAALQSSITTLTQSVQEAQASAQLASQTGPSIVQSASIPSAPTTPRKARDLVLGILGGLVLGLLLAVVVDRLDDGLRSREQSEQASGHLPTLALIPVVESWRKEGLHLALVEDPNSFASEGYRTLRTSVQFLGVDAPKRVIGITSSVPGEGKSTTAANLGQAYAQAGFRTTVVSCDLRRPTLHKFFGLSNEEGLTSVLVGTVPVSSVRKQVRDEPLLSVVPSGPIPPNPAELLTSKRLHSVITSITNVSDIVILDCPPMLPVSDTLLLTKLVEGMVVVACARVTKATSFRRTYELLRQVDTPLLGTVLNKVPQRETSYGYGRNYYDYVPSGVDSSPGSNGVPSPEAAEGRKIRAASPVTQSGLTVGQIREVRRQ